jgi:hypothetical protein
MRLSHRAGKCAAGKRMKPFNLAMLVLPDQALVPLLTLAGLSLIVGLRKLAGVLFGFVLMMAFAPLFAPLLETVFAAMPPWFFIVFVAGVMVHLFRRAIRDVAVHVAGDLIASGIKFMCRHPVAVSAVAALAAAAGWLAA